MEPLQDLLLASVVLALWYAGALQISIAIPMGTGIPKRILTNDASRSQEQQVESFSRLGLDGFETHEVITSGMMAKHFLQHKITEGKIAYLGTENSAHYILQSGLEHISVRDIEMDNITDISAFVFFRR